MEPLAIDLFCGLGGWTEGLLAEGYRVVGFDNERHRYPAYRTNENQSTKVSGLSPGKFPPGGLAQGAIDKVGRTTEPIGWQEYPAQLVIQDVLTLHGSQFKDAALIVASPPCQEYSYMAMPWTLAKEKQARILADPVEQKRLTALFDACFRIQREASEAAGRHIPLVVENVRGAQPWVGRAAWNFGSFYLWGDVPALMPATTRAVKVPSDKGRRTDVGNGTRFTSRDCGVENTGIKNGGDWFGSGADCSLQRHFSGIKQTGISGLRINGKGDRWFQDGAAQSGSKSKARKAASAAIAKIPFVLAQHIARVYKPENYGEASTTT